MGETECGFSVETKSNAIAALNVVRRKEIRHLGLALVEPDSFKLQLCEFCDDDHLTFLEMALLQTRPIKCVIKLTTDNAIDHKKLQNVFVRCGVTLLHGNASDFAEVVEVENVKRLLKESEQTRFLTSDFQALQLARQSLGCILKEWEVLHDVSYYHQFSLEILTLNKFVRLDKAAFSALNLLPAPGDRLRSPTSLFGFLNKCRTPFGQTRLTSWITQPSRDRELIIERHDIVQLFVSHIDLRQSLQQEYLRPLPNFDQLTTKLHKAALKAPSELSNSQCSLEDLSSLHEGLVETNGALAVLELVGRRSAGQKESETLERRILTPLRKALDKLKRFHDLIEYTFDPSELARGKCLINRTFDAKLKSLGDKKDSSWQQIEKHRAEVEDDIGLGGAKKTKSGTYCEAVKLLECGSLGFVFRVTKKDQRIVQSNKSLYEPVRVNKAEFQFTTKRLTMLAGEYMQVSEEFETQQQQLAQKTISAAATYWPVIETVSEIVALVDILAGFAEVASNGTFKYVRPKIRPLGESRVIKLTACRHPLVEQQLLLRRPDSTMKNFIPNSIDMEAPERLLNVITGPNMGGKSTYIRQIALTCLLSQIGSFVPCAAAELSMIDSILCRVGASDDQLRGISTFLAEMIEANAIVKSATSDSLVLVDELGRGTSTFEGFGLAWEIARYLTSTTKCFTLFATHFHEMGDLEKELPGVFNSRVTASIDCDANRLMLLFQVKPGCADFSYGMQVAEMAGLDNCVLEKAKTKAQELEAHAIGRKRERFEEVLSGIKRLCGSLGGANVLRQEFMESCFKQSETFAEILDLTE